VAIGDFHPEDFSPLEEPAARSLIRLMAQFSGVLHRAAESFEVHPLTDYLTALAGAYHHYYFHHRILSAEDADRPVMMARIGLSMAVGRILASGLALLGVRAPDSM
jgi:arginyl-tRNA synthetase